MSVLTIIITLFCLLLILYWISTRKFNYWLSRNVIQPAPLPLFGNYIDYIILRKSIHEVVRDVCVKFPKEPYIGVYYGTLPTLIVQEPELIKQIFTKDFYYFNGREASEYSHREAITKTLFFTSGDRWRVIRQNLTPLFSSAKMKKMFYLIEECSNIFLKLLDDVSEIPSVEIKALVARYTIDCIGSCGFGIQTKAMLVEKNNPFFVIGQMIFEASNVRGFKNMARAVWPDLFYKLGFELFPSELTEFFDKLLKDVFKERNYKDSGRHDFVDLVLSLKQNKHLDGDSIKNLKGGTEKCLIEADNDFLSAQCMLFFAAGYETSATTLSFLLYELAKNSDKQRRAIAEVDEYFKRRNKLEYECLFETPYLEACINETLRLYPVLGVLTREVVEDFKLPSGVLLNKGVRIHIPVYSIHRDPKYFPNPDDFIPERFLGNEKDNIIPFTFLPFGEGPRICIGMRFAKMQVTAGLLTILRKCHIGLTKDTITKVDFEPRSITTQCAKGIHLKFTLRS
ncbi:cytochrome P450 6B5-like [Pieris napi]|uniref:cytochrome P450 6B5-like n=1 Tax=Pieris napi TaxID=78633 RepID=UPI001FB8A58F|nr:cytochrome P450 6B5-like [Pieris napi]